METELAIYIGWAVIGVVGAVWLGRKGYFADSMDYDRGARTDIQWLGQDGTVPDVEPSSFFNRIVFPALGGPLTLIAALVLPKKERHVV